MADFSDSRVFSVTFTDFSFRYFVLCPNITKKSVNLTEKDRLKKDNEKIY